MTTLRSLTEEEMVWLAETPMGKSHQIEGNDNLGACEECDWTAQGDSFSYIMEQATIHLNETLAEHIKIRQQLFKDTFGWDPWKEGSIVGGVSIDDLEAEEWDSSVVCDILEVVETDEESGTVISEDRYIKELGHYDELVDPDGEDDGEYW